MGVITVEQLRAAGACESKVRLFRERFGGSARVTVAAARGVAALFDWDWAADHLLSSKASADYWAKCKPLDDDYQAKCKPLDADYAAKCKPLDADYEAKRELLYADYEAKRKLLDDDYWAKRAALFARCYNSAANRG